MVRPTSLLLLICKYIGSIFTQFSLHIYDIQRGHVGSVAAAGLAGLVSYALYPHIKFCFLVVGISAVVACYFVTYLPEGDSLMGRGFATPAAVSGYAQIEQADSDETKTDDESDSVPASDNIDQAEPPVAATYWKVFADPKSIILCSTGFFFQ